MRTGLRIFKKLLGLTLLFTIAAAAWYLADLPDTTKLLKQNPKTSAVRLFREEQVREMGKEPHSTMTWRSLSQISPDLAHAVVLSEDDTFFQHHGFDIEQIKRAARINWERKRFAFGGSTLTQQLARTLYLSSRKNLLRKAKEALITRRLEKTLPKRRILELYMNVVEWGPQVYGAEAAARHFYGKAAIDLTPEEAISLAAILPSPLRWNPLSEKKFMAQRKAILYDRMVRARFITPVVSTETVISPSLEGERLSPEDVDPSLENLPDEDSVGLGEPVNDAPRVAPEAEPSAR